MKTVQISSVRFIKEDKDKNPLNLFVLNLTNGKPAIVRSAKEFLTDLQNSYLIGAHVRNPNHPELLAVLRDLKGATVTGDILFAKQGELWTVTENSRVVTDKNHPKYGKVAVGDKLPYEKDMTLVQDGFLDVALSPQMAMMNKQAQAYGMSLASMLNAFETVDTVDSIAQTTTEPLDLGAIDLDEDVANEAVGSLTPEETTN